MPSTQQIIEQLKALEIFKEEGEEMVILYKSTLDSIISLLEEKGGDVSDEEAVRLADERFPTDLTRGMTESDFNKLRIGFIEGYRSLRQQLSKEQGGMRWVKYVENKPDIGIHASDLHWRYADTKKPVFFNYYRVIENLIIENNTESPLSVPLRLLEWLDEGNTKEQQRDILLKVSADVIACQEQAIEQRDALLKDMAELLKQSNDIIKSIMPEQINTEDAREVDLYHSFHFNNDAIARYNQLPSTPPAP